MRRRDLLTVSAAVAGWTSLPAIARAAISRTAADGGLTHSLLCPPNRYEITVQGHAVTVGCFAADAAAGPPPMGSMGSVAAGEPMVRVGRGRRAVYWRVQDWRQHGHQHILTLRARGQPLQAEVTFACDPRTGLLTRRTLLRHIGGKGEIDIRTTLGFAATIHERIPRIVHLAGGWQEEMEIQRMDPGEDGLLLESREGKTSFAEQPYVALRAANATYVCQIFWSGNWHLRVAPYDGGAAIFGGLNNWRFRHRLRPGRRLVLPTVLFGRVDGGINVATQRLHDYRRAHRPDPDRAIPVQYNSWYPYFGEPTAEALLPLVPIARRLGCEVFVIDAGWYRTDEGDSDAEWDERTGDWRVSRTRFPQGLREISTRCHAEGLKFGLWFEPEAIGPTSSIRREHPEWLHHIDGRLPPATDRAILNLGVPQAWEHVFERITSILRRLEVDWMKWDFNADLEASGGWAPTLPKDLIGQAPLVAHYHALYRMQDAIRTLFPNLTLEMCAGGGGRMDGEILSHAHVNWISDQAGVLHKLAIHFGTRLAHPAVACNDWLIDWMGSDREDGPALTDDRGDLPFRLRVAMLGSFGISAPIEQWPEDDLNVAAAHVTLYKERLRAIIQHGDQYFLTMPPPPDGNGDWAAIWYAAKDGSAGVLFAFRLAGPHPGRLFQLPGLRAAGRYRVSLFSGGTAVKSGEALARGFVIEIAETFRSELCLVEMLPA